MTDIKPGDYVRQVTEGRVTRLGVPTLDGRATAYVRRPDRSESWCYVDELTVIDPPVRVGDEISYEQAIRLPDGSALLGLSVGNAYQVHRTVGGARDLWFGIALIVTSAKAQTFRVLHIPTEATS